VVLKQGSDVDEAVVMAELESLKTKCFYRLIQSAILQQQLYLPCITLFSKK
jgi:hypothetical protein